MYIRLKSAFDKNRLSAQDYDTVEPVLRETPNQNNPKMKNRAISNSRDTLFMQCAVLNLRGQDLGEKFIPSGGLVCTGSLFNPMGKCLADAHAAGIDVFDPAAGYTLIIDSLPANPKINQMTAVFTVRLGDQMEITQEHVAQYVKPWEAVMNYLTYDQQLRKLVNAFGRAVVAVAFPAETSALFADSPAPGSVHAAPPATGQAVLARSATVRPTATAASARPAVAVAPAKAVLGKSVALPTTIKSLGRPASVAATPVVSVAATGASELEAEYEKLLAQQQAQGAPE